MRNRLEFALESYALITLITKIRTIEFGGLDLQPRYQRNYIWKNDFKDKLIYSIIKGYPIGSIIIRQLKDSNEKGADMEIVDGQQRLTTIYEFIECKYEIHSDISRKIIEAIVEIYGERNDNEFEKLKKKLTNKGKIRLRYSDLPTIIRGRFEGFNVSVTKILEASEEEITEYFRFLQNQERLRAGEILNSLVNSKMDKYLNQIDNLDEFCSIIGFENGRKEFDKLFYNIMGVLDNKVSLGAPDREINKYVTNTEEITEGQAQVEMLLYQINTVTEILYGEKIIYKPKKRYIKFMMLLMGLNLIDFTTDTQQKLIALQTLDNKLSVFFSTNPSVIIKNFEGYSNDVIEELSSIALISKGAQSLERVQNRMEILAHYVKNVDENQNPSNIKII